MSYVAFVLSDISRAKIIERFKPKFPDVIAHHVTHRMGVSNIVDTTNHIIAVYGYVKDDSLEALLVTVNGRSTRPDGKKYHITLSLDRSLGRKPVDSNKVIEQCEVIHTVPFIIFGTLQNCN